MRRIITIVVVVTLIATVGVLNGEAQEGQKLYTAYNIWKTAKMMCINFKQGYDIIPAGTVVKDVHIWQSGNKSYIRFKTVEDGREYTIGFFEKWHPKKKIKDYRDKMFTIKNFEDLTKGLTEMEIKAIKKGVLVNGMSKRAVLISYGHPPEHYTPNQGANTWYYWMNRRDKITLLFNQDNRLVRGG